MLSRKTLIPLVLLGWIASVSAETEAPPSTAWTHQLVGNLTANQVALKDWAQGGEDALSWSVSVEGKSARERELTQWVTSYKFALGQTKLGDEEIRKTVDRIDLESTLTYTFL